MLPLNRILLSCGLAVALLSSVPAGPALAQKPARVERSSTTRAPSPHQAKERAQAARTGALRSMGRSISRWAGHLKDFVGRGKAHAELRQQARKLVEKAKVRTAPLASLGYGDSYAGEGPLTIYRTGSGKPDARYFWFHGAGQSTENEMITRLANAFHEAGLNLEIYSMPYGQDRGLTLARELIRTSPGKVLIGGHSAGGGPVGSLVSEMSDKIDAVATFNAGKPAASGVPAIHFIGENDGGARLLGKKPWRSRHVRVTGTGIHRAAVLRQGDHSARFRRRNDGDKEGASTSKATKHMNRAAADTLKAFLTEHGILSDAPEPRRLLPWLP